jgi:catechol 2,3-dioxygenase-like lactoylglutathione lyase family enzyme
MSATDAPVLAGIHHLKLPVTDLARSLEWYRSRLGYQVQVEFVEQGTLMGCGLAHPAGGPDLALRLEAARTLDFGRPAMAIDAKAPAQMWAGVALKPAFKP